jgi:acetolactate synthase-1/3 small subunit
MEIEKKIYTISVFAENSPGVLQRLTTLFTKRKLNIESITASETEQKGISRFTIIIKVVEDLVDTLVKQIRRIVEVHEAFYSTNEDLLHAEVAFIRVFTDSDDTKRKIEELAHRNGGHLVYATDNSIVIQKTGSYSQVQILYRLLEPYGISEFIRSGGIAIRKKAKPQKFIIDKVMNNN